MSQYNFHSHEQQDEFIFNLFEFKTEGLFLDVSCGNPLIGSNTASLEKYLNWSGFCFDIYNVQQKYNWSEKRKTPFIQMDATSENFTNFLKENIPPNTVVDYLSLDIDADSILALKRIINAGITFASVTFEHEFHRLGDVQQKQSREILESVGMVRLFEDVRIPAVLTNQKDSVILFEDWWIHPKYIDPSVLSIKNLGQFYQSNVEKLKNFKQHTYECQHLCSQAWPNEYRLFWHAGEEAEFRQKFKIFYES